MPGLFDGMRISSSGLRVHSVLEEVVGQNIANASNEGYSRQKVTVNSLGSVITGNLIFGQGVQATQIERVRDELLDTQLRASSSDAATYSYKLSWLQKIQSLFNEPSDNGINAALSQFWTSWSQLAADPENLATRSTVMSRTGDLTNLLNTTSGKLSQYTQELDGELQQQVNDINTQMAQIAKLNADIFHIEAGRTVKANELRDERDACIDKLAADAGIQTREDVNGMINITIAGHLGVSGDKVEKLVVKSDIVDPSHKVVVWENGDRLGAVTSGKLSAILDLRDDVLGGYQGDLDTLASALISKVNELYSTGTGLQPQKLLESNLGYEALGVTKATAPLNLVEAGKSGAIHISFYDANDKLVRSQAIVIDSSDSLNDIAEKLDAIPGLNATVLNDDTHEGRLSLSLDTLSGENTLGEVGFTVTNPVAGYDTSGVLNLLGFSQTDKSTNTGSTAPVLTSRDLTELQQELGVGNVADVRSHALNLSGTFTINAYETATETPPYTDGNRVSQWAIHVDSSDSIDDIMDKVNALTTQYGLSMSFNAVTNKLELTSTAKTDDAGNIMNGGTHTVRLAFINGYQYPAVTNDRPPEGYTGRGDNTGLFGKLQCNTLLQGSSAADIALDVSIVNPSQIHAGYSLSPGDNALALALTNLQYASVVGDSKSTFSENYGDTVSRIGNEVSLTQNLSDNEAAMLEGFKAERDSVSGVNLDEELANMIQYQKSYEANARALSTFSQLADELLRLI